MLKPTRTAITQSPLSQTSVKLLALALILLCLLSCGPSPPPWNKIITKTEKGSESAPVTSAEELVVYLDSSSSMAGYILPGSHKSSVFSRTLQELRNFSTIVKPAVSVHVRRVDATVGEALNDTYLTEASITRAAFNGKETNLAGAIQTFTLERHNADAVQKVGLSASDAPTPTPRFHILVTDGVQSTSQRHDDSCATGSDQFCVRKRILELLDKNWGAYVIGLRSEFDGKIFSEINHSTFAYKTQDNNYNTYRPFYLYLFSPDRAALDELVATLQTRLRAIVNHEDAIRALALTSNYTAGPGRGQLSIPKESSSALTGDAVQDESPVRFTLKVSLDTEHTGPKPFSLSAGIAWSPMLVNSGTPAEIASLVKWDLVPVYPAENTGKKPRLPEVKLIDYQPQPDGQINLRFTARWPPANGSPDWRGYRLEGHLKLDQQTPEWIRQWSTELDVAPDTANRTLFLESALLGLWRNPQLEKQTIATMYLRVGPK